MMLGGRTGAWVSLATTMYYYSAVVIRVSEYNTTNKLVSSSLVGFSC